ncbi:Protein N-terminal amidase [Schizosaccharomyces pombe]
MKFGCVQFFPKLGKVNENIVHLRQLLDQHSEALQSVKLLVFPEMCLTGYNFKNSESIQPFLENVTSNHCPSIQFAQEVSEQYRCYTIIGFPEFQNSNGISTLYNSTALISPKKELLNVYHKHFLFETDKSWATEGKGFSFEPCIPELGPISMAICMDINPYDFKAPFEKFEYANFILRELEHQQMVSSNVSRPIICLSMAWLVSDDKVIDASQPDIKNLHYWTTRLSPLINSNTDAIVLVANRWGKEDDLNFSGTSCIMELSQGRAILHGVLKAAENGIVVGELEK